MVHYLTFTPAEIAAGTHKEVPAIAGKTISVIKAEFAMLSSTNAIATASRNFAGYYSANVNALAANNGFYSLLNTIDTPIGSSRRSLATAATLSGFSATGVVIDTIGLPFWCGFIAGTAFSSSDVRIAIIYAAI